MSRTARSLQALAAVLVTAIGIAAPAGSIEDAGWSPLVPRVAGARHYYISPDGKPENPGTREAPWDLPSGLSGRQKVAPGDHVWVRGGSYRSDTAKFELGLAGREDAPIHVRAVPGERATILDNGILTAEGIAHVWLWDLEITTSVPVAERTSTPVPDRPASTPSTVGIWARAGKGCKFINLAIHDNAGGGVNWWTEAGEGELHGCLLIGNGWRPYDNKHGHALYVQNRDGVKRVSSCILGVATDFESAVHAFGTERAWVDNLVLEDNIVLGSGLVRVGCGRPSHGIHVLRNYLQAGDLRIGNGPQNEDCEVRSNVIAGGKLTIDKFRTARTEDNREGLPTRMARLIPNKYDPNRAHLVAFNGAKADSVAADAAGFLKPGERYRLLDPKDPFGSPVVQGACDGPTISVPMKQAEFAVYVVQKGGKP